ncbi:hypothetical protein BHE74_00016888 [Ensete ventricosum]|nr:hypothetical protein GW17_00008171 [Ensete ventricosum]RWW75106.1 hypothetical protein BHE74_00016888 [Ensete ventricosum]
MATPLRELASFLGVGNCGELTARRKAKPCEGDVTTVIRPLSVNRLCRAGDLTSFTLTAASAHLLRTPKCVVNLRFGDRGVSLPPWLPVWISPSELVACPLRFSVGDRLCFFVFRERMEKKQGFFSALREEVARGLSPARARARSRSESPRRSPSPVANLLLPRRWKRQPARGFPAELLVPASGSLAPLAEGPEGDGGDPRKEGWGRWVMSQLYRAPSVSAPSCRSSDLRLLLGVMGAPLAPVHVSPVNSLPHLSIKDTPIVSTPLPIIHLIFLPPAESLLR